MTPTSLFSSSTTGIASRLYDATCRATSSWSMSTRAVIRSAVMIRLSGVSGETSSSRRNGRHPDDVPAFVDHVEIEDHLDVAVDLQLRDGLADRHVLAEREDIWVHDAAGGLLVVLEQVLDGRRTLSGASSPGPRSTTLPGGKRSGPRRRRRNLLGELCDLFGRARGQQRRAVSGPSSEIASIASRPFRSASRLRAAWRSLSWRSLKIRARSAGCCFCSRFRRFAVAPMRSSRLTESRTRSILRCAAMIKIRPALTNN